MSLDRHLLVRAHLTSDILALLGGGGVDNSVGLCGALLLAGALLFIHNGALLLGNIFVDGVALRNSSSGTLFFGHTSDCGSTLRYSCGVAFLLRFCFIVSDCFCIADIFSHDIIGDMTLWCSIRMSISMSIGGLCIGICLSQDGRHKANKYQELLHVC